MNDILKNSEFKLIKKSLPYNLKKSRQTNKSLIKFGKKIKSKNYESKINLRN